MSEQPSGSEARRTLLRARRLVDVAGVIDDGWLLVEGDRIVAVGSGGGAPTADAVEDLGDVTLTPGFIDLHGHGGAGGAYDDDATAIRRALAVHRAHGTTRSVLSLVANPVDRLVTSLATIRDVMAADPLVLGAHLEGPFLSPHNRGAHEPAFLRDPTPDVVKHLLEAGAGIIRQVTIAPELPGALDAIRTVVDAGAVAAIGHTVCDATQAAHAFDAGATLLTHAFNAMPGIHHRSPGPIVAAIEDDRVTLELILDGVHVDPSVATILFRSAPGRVALVTDAMAATGAADGEYTLGSLAVEVEGGLARLAGSTTIAGSTLTQDIAVRNAIERCGVPITEAVAAVTAIPAAALGIDDRFGRLAGGFVADIVALDQDLGVHAVWADGLTMSI